MSFCGDRESWKTRREQISANNYYEDAAQQRDNYNKYETVVHCVLWYYGIMVFDLRTTRTN